MQYYVELLRVKRALYVAGFILALFFLVAVILRFSVHGRTIESWVAQTEGSPTAHVSTVALPNGWKKTIVTDPSRGITATIENKGNRMTIDATVPQSESAGLTNHDMVMGNVDQNVSTTGGRTHVTIRYRSAQPSYDLGFLFLLTLPITLIVSTMLGGVLSKENDGHLEMVWTKPLSRERYAASAIAVDALGIFVSELVTIGVVLLATLMFFVPRFSWNAEWGLMILFATFAPLAWYAAITVASTSLKRGPGLVMGLGWVIGLFVPAIAGVLVQVAPYSTIAAGFAAIFRGLCYLDPIAYLTFHSPNGSARVNAGAPEGLLHLSYSGEIAVLGALFVVYCALSVVQWRRVEA